jgi:hypothetical protein
VSLRQSISAHPKRFYLTVCALLFVAALLRYWVSYDPSASVSGELETYRIAHNIYQRGQFANPFGAAETGPSAHLPPVFPGLLAGLMWLFGDKSAGMYAIRLTGALILSLQLALYPLFSRALGMGRLTGVIGASLWIWARPVPFYGWEAFYASFALAGACCLYRSHLDLHEPGWGTWMLGCLMGLLSLMAPVTVPVFGAWLVWEIWRRKAVFFQRFLLPLVVLPALIVLPWAIRNYRVFHRFIPVRDNLGLELAISNNDCAGFSMEENFGGCFQLSHPNSSTEEAGKVIDLGEADYNRMKFREALVWIKAHPRRFARLSAERFVAWWMPTETGARDFADYAGEGREWERFVIYLVTVLSFAGLAILFRRDVQSAVVCGLCLAVFPVVYYFIQYGDRYRYPVMWLTFLLGALPISTFARWVFLRDGL